MKQALLEAIEEAAYRMATAAADGSWEVFDAAARVLMAAYDAADDNAAGRALKQTIVGALATFGVPFAALEIHYGWQEVRP